MTTNIVHKQGILSAGNTYNNISFDSENNKILYGGSYGAYFNGGLSYRDASSGNMQDFYTAPPSRYNSIDVAFVYVNDNGTF